MNISIHMKKVTLALGFSLLVAIPGISRAVDVSDQEPSQEPLNVAVNAMPAMTVVLDDSGSMHFEVVADGYQGLLDILDLLPTSHINFDRGRSYELAPFIPVYASLRAPHLNRMYFDPKKANDGFYQSWHLPDGTPKSKIDLKVDANGDMYPKEAYSDPVVSTKRFNLENQSFNAVFNVRDPDSSTGHKYPRAYFKEDGSLLFDFDRLDCNGSNCTDEQVDQVVIERFYRGSRLLGRFQRNIPIENRVYYLKTEVNKELSFTVEHKYQWNSPIFGWVWNPSRYRSEWVMTTPGSYDTKDRSVNFGNCATGEVNTRLADLATYGSDKVKGTNKTLIEALMDQGVDSFGTDGSCLKKYTVSTTNTDMMKAYANWYSFHRTRSAALKYGLGETYKSIDNFKIGLMSLHGNNVLNTKPSKYSEFDSGKADYKTTLIDMYVDMYGLKPGGGTPNRQAMKRAGDSLRNQNKFNGPIPVTKSCQRNFILQFTDGYTNGFPHPLVGNIDLDKTEGPYSASYRGDLGDIAAEFYYNFNRGGDLPTGSDVPVHPNCGTSKQTARMDCNKKLHVNTYTISLGTKGEQFGRSVDNVKQVYDSATVSGNVWSYNWPSTSQPNSPAQVDDLLHAAVNGRGEAYFASGGAELSDKLQQALNDIKSAIPLSVNSVASSSARVRAGEQIFVAGYTTKDWTGDLIAYEIDNNGQLVQALDTNNQPTGKAKANWSAAELLDARTASRHIITSGASGLAGSVPVAWSALTTDEKNALKGDGDAAFGQERLAYLLGSKMHEDTVTVGGTVVSGKFRNRASILGDIVNSAPTYVGEQNYGYAYSSSSAMAGSGTYQAYVDAKKTKTKMVLVGANDGMLHAFDATTGNELWAYLPRTLLQAESGKTESPLVALTKKDYQHQFYVDATVSIHDVYDSSSSSWKTIAVGALGAGGKAVFALDITNRSTPRALWEFTHDRLGYHMGDIDVGLDTRGKFNAYIASGYGLNKPGSLFVVDLLSGPGASPFMIETHKINNYPAPGQPLLPGQDNGLSAAISVDSTLDRVVDYVYAGDLYGNLWKFDMTDRNNNPKWEVAHNGKPLFTACSDSGSYQPFACPTVNRQPIQAKPEVGFAPVADKGLAVYFGTGIYYRDKDRSITSGLQSFYGIFDGSGTTVPKSKLLKQEIKTLRAVDVENGIEGARTVTQNKLDTVHEGWYLDNFQNGGTTDAERVIYQPLLRSGRIIFTTLVPANLGKQNCGGGGSSWIMVLNAVNGGSLPDPVLDINGDGSVNDSDNIGGDPVVGTNSGSGVIGTPTVLDGIDQDVIFTQSSGNGTPDSRNIANDNNKGRSSWMRTYPQ